MTQIVATWMNEEKTVGARLWDNGVLEVNERDNSGQMWPIPAKLQPFAFEVKPDDRCNLIGVTWHR